VCECTTFISRKYQKRRKHWCYFVPREQEIQVREYLSPVKMIVFKERGVLPSGRLAAVAKRCPSPTIVFVRI
jgi:hypothetical protein